MTKQSSIILAILFFLFSNYVFAVVADSTKIAYKTRTPIRWGFVLYKNRDTLMCTSQCDLVTNTYVQCPPRYTAYALVAPNDNDYGGTCSLQSYNIQFNPTLEPNSHGGYQIHFRQIYAILTSNPGRCNNGAVTFDYTIFCI